MLSARRSVVGCLGIFVALAGSVNATTIVPPTFADGTIGTEYEPVILVCSLGLAPFVWSVPSGLPPGMSCSADGIISGTPTTAGTYNFTIHAVDDNDYEDTEEGTIIINELGEGESGGTVSVPDGLQWESISGAFGMPAWWYEGPAQTGIQPGAYFGSSLIDGGPNESRPGLDGTVGAGAAGLANSDAAHVFANYQQVVNACNGVACTLCNAPSYDGCGYAFYKLTVVFRREPQYSGGPTIYYGFIYTICHGRNGYVSWSAGTKDGSSLGGGRYVSIDGMQHWSPMPLASNATYWSMKFPATAALNSLLNNSNGLVLWGPGQAPTYSASQYSRLAGTTNDSRLRTLLGYLRDSLSSQVDMKPYIPRCASQDVEASGGGGGTTPTDHVLDDAASEPSWVDTDGDGVADFADSFPSNSTRGYYPDNQGVWDALKNKFPKWAWTGAGTDTMNTTTFTGYSLVWKRPVAGGSPVTLFTTVIDTNPANNPVSAAGTALDALRVIVRSLGTAMVAFWTLWGVLITIRQW